MRLRVPHRISLHGKTCTVKNVESVDNDDSDGEYSNNVIRMRKGQTDEDLEWTYWHEVFHFFCDATGIARNDVGIPDLAEEMLCDAFADLMTNNFKVTGRKRK
jgi:hypothetical protein